MPKIEAVDLFCGAGGLTHGLIKSGVSVRAGYDIDESCRYPYEVNNQAVFELQSVADLTGEQLAKWYSPGAIRLLAGCAPCQPFSTLAKADNIDAEKWSLLFQFGRLIKELQPELVTMENVPGVIHHAPFQEFKKTLIKLNYHVDAKVVRCADYGVPQERKRYVLIASKLGPIQLDSAEKYMPSTVRDAISHLPPIEAGEKCKKDRLHQAQKLSDINLKRIKASVPGGTWQDWPKSLRSPCHNTERGSSFKSVYARMSWDKAAPTMTTQFFNYGTGRFGHPEQNRAITLREAAILQSFPDDYIFVPPETPVRFGAVGRMIGNAVPPKLGYIVGKTFENHLRLHHGSKISR